MNGIYIKTGVSLETKRIIKGYAGKHGLSMGEALNELVKAGEYATTMNTGTIELRPTEAS